MELTGNKINAMSKKMYEKTKKQIKDLSIGIQEDFKSVYDVHDVAKVLKFEQFEPKKNNRFFLKFPKKANIPVSCVKSSTRPSFPLCNDINIVLYDPLHLNLTKNLLALINDYEINGNMFKLNMEMLDPIGNVMETFILTDCLILKIEWSPLDYANDDLAYINLTVRYKDLKIKNKKYVK